MTDPSLSGAGLSRRFFAELVEDRLPEQFAGFPVRFPVTWDRTDPHNVEVATVADFAVSRPGLRRPDQLARRGQGPARGVPG